MIKAIATIFSLAFIGVASLAGSATAADLAGRAPVVVELFTSQGCSSCPPAEAFLTDLAKRDDVIALEFHVDYWDYIGWKDSFAKPEFTKRQKRYVSSLQGRYAYTPQMVIQGRADVVGSHRDDVESVIRRYLAEDPKGPAISIKRKGDVLIVIVGAGTGAGTDPYDVLLVTFDKPHLTEVRRGENRGKTLKNSNVVRELVRLGAWTGKSSKFDISLDGREGDGGCAVLLQKPNQGPIVAAAKLPFER
jgi:hypothetical protein